MVVPRLVGAASFKGGAAPLDPADPKITPCTGVDAPHLHSNTNPGPVTLKSEVNPMDIVVPVETYVNPSTGKIPEVQ